MEMRRTTLWCAAVGRCWVLRWEEAAKGTPTGKVRTASPKLVVEGIGYCCVTWWRPALMQTEGEEDAAEGKASVKGSCNRGDGDGDESVRLLWFWWGRLWKKEMKIGNKSWGERKELCVGLWWSAG
jgi:hypothetical protein